MPILGNQGGMKENVSPGDYCASEGFKIQSDAVRVHLRVLQGENMTVTL